VGFSFDELELAPEEIIQPLVDFNAAGVGTILSLSFHLSPYHKNLV